MPEEKQYAEFITDLLEKFDEKIRTLERERDRLPGLDQKEILQTAIRTLQDLRDKTMRGCPRISQTFPIISPGEVEIV